MKKILLIISAITFLVTCQKKEVSFYDIPKLDSHVHLRTENTGFIETLENTNFNLISICTRSSDQNYIDEQFNYGLIDSLSIVYFVLFIITFLSLSIYRLENERFQ